MQASGDGTQNVHYAGDESWIPQDNRYYFEDKVATNPALMYKSGEKLKWSKVTRNYMIGRCPDARSFFTVD